MRVEFHPAANQELDEAVAYYDGQAAGLGDEFVQAVAEAIQRINAFPAAWARLSANTRRCRTAKFPYGIIYSVTGETLYIIALMHLHRKPDYWKDRVSEQ